MQNDFIREKLTVTKSRWLSVFVFQNSYLVNRQKKKIGRFLKDSNMHIFDNNWVRNSNAFLSWVLPSSNVYCENESFEIANK